MAQLGTAQAWNLNRKACFRKDIPETLVKFHQSSSGVLLRKPREWRTKSRPSWEIQIRALAFLFFAEKSLNTLITLETRVKDQKKKNRNPLDNLMNQLEQYEEGCDTEDLMSSGE